MNSLLKRSASVFAKKGTLFLAGVAVAAGSTAIVQAAIPSSNGTINGCYNKLTGALKVKDTEAGQTCNGLENSLSWSSQSGASQAISYVRLNDDGTLDTSYSRGVISADITQVPGSDPAIYNVCLRMAVTPKMAQRNSGGPYYGGGVAAAGDPNTAADIQDNCGSGYNAGFFNITQPYGTRIGVFFN